MIFRTVLFMALFATAIGIIWSRHQHRVLFIELQAEQNAWDEMYERWSALQLEQGTWAAHHRAEDIAREHLGLDLPQEEVLVFVDRGKDSEEDEDHE